MPHTDALLNLQQVADYLQLNQSTVYQWAQQGRLPAIKLGGRWRFRRADIEGWLDAQARQPGAALDSDGLAVSRKIEDSAHDGC